MKKFRMFQACLIAIAALVTAPAQAEVKSEWVEYSHGNVKLKGYIAYDDRITGKRPAVLMIHARDGMTASTRQFAEMWAKLGYVTFAAEGILPKDIPEMQAQTTIYTNDRALMRARTQAGFDALVRNPMVDPSRVALIGYCFGGAVGVEFGSTGAPLVANVAIVSSGGNGTPAHLAGELLKREAKLEIVHVPYKGAAAGAIAVLPGDVDMMIGATGVLTTYVKSGRLRAGSPKNVIERLHAEIAKAVALPETRQRFEPLGLEAASMLPAEFAAHMREEARKWGKLVRDAGIKAD